MAGAQWVSTEGLGQSWEAEVSGLSSPLADEAWWLRPPQERTSDKAEMPAELRLLYIEG